MVAQPQLSGCYTIMHSHLSVSIVHQLYDHKSETNTKKTLMPRHAVATRTLDVSRNGVGSTGDHDDINDYQIIDSAPFDIILCEFCDAELYSEQAYRVCLCLYELSYELSQLIE